jgi:hypothetical protein
MPSDFDDAFASAQAQRDAAIRDEHNLQVGRLRKQRVARQIAEPLLRKVGYDARRKLLELNVLPETHTLQKSRWYQRGLYRYYWLFYSHELYLTEDGYFTGDPAVPSEEGFEALVQRIPLAHNFLTHGSFIYINEETRELMVQYGFSRDIDGTRMPFVDFIANRVISLRSAAQSQASGRS